MRKVGTISSSIGLIFLGIWMILNRTNHLYAEGMIKWWPVIIILMGVEVLVYFSRKSENERIGFSFLIIPVILIFLFVNMYQGIGNKFKFNTDFNNGISFNNMIDYFRDIDSDRYKIISTSKSLEAKINTLTLNIDNADLNIIKSSDGKTKLDLKIYVNKNESTNNYNIKDTINGDNANININENYIKKVSGDIYIADGCNVIFSSDNIRLNSKEDIGKSAFKINSNNSYINVNDVKDLSIDSDNISAEIKRADTFYTKCDSGMIKINGNVDNIKLIMENGKVNIDNESEKNAEIKLDDGMVNYKTNNKNVDVSLELDNGICNLNGERRVNSGITQKIGNGESKIKIEVNNGTLSFTS